jgi:hypothetical protein
MPKAKRRKNELKLKKPRLGTIPNINVSMRSKWMFIVLFIVAYGIFYLFLRDKLPFTPDFGSSDAFHSNVSFKYYLWQSIRSGVLPFWTDKLAGGFPLIAETQIGAFFLPDYVIFPIFSNFSHAYMFLFAFHLALLSIGMFLLLCLFQIPSFLSFLLAVTFTWSGAVSFRWVHFNFLQVFSLGPLLFWSYFKWNLSQKKIYLLVISALICQMIFAGHMQTTFILLLGLILTHLSLHYPFKLTKNILFFSSIFFGFIFALPQILPTIQFAAYSARSFLNSYQYVVSYIFNSKDLIGFFSSHGLGTPLNATYGSLQAVGNRIYWENTPYLGELFIITLFFASIYYYISLKKQSIVTIFLVLALLFLFLAFGGDSPLYFLFGVFPFNMFRTPSRYLLVCVFFLILFSAHIFKTLINKSSYFLIFIYCILIINSAILIKTSFNYHVFIDSKQLLSSLKKYNPLIKYANYFTFAGNEAWYSAFTTKGWGTNKDIDTFLFLNSSLLPNSNLISGVSTFDIYTGGLKMRRNEYLKSLITDSLTELSRKQETPDAGMRAEKLLSLYNIKTILSLKPLYLPHFSLIQSNKKNDLTITLWQNTSVTNNLFYSPHKIKSLTYLEDIEKEMESEPISDATAFVESLPVSINQTGGIKNIQILKNIDHSLISNITAIDNSFIVVKKGWYPEWHLFIDGKEKQIYKTNLIHMGFYIPKGNHTVELRYVPTSFYIGALLSLLGIFIYSTYCIRKN